MAQLHEDLARTESLEPGAGSERSFGVVFAIVFALIGTYPLFSLGPVRYWALALAAAFMLLAWLRPSIFRVPNRIWFRFGVVLAAIVGPVAVGLVFVTSVVPVGLLMRLIGKDPLRLGRDAAARSYWIERTPPGPDPKGMPDQF